jgi:hypothetical protein
MIQSGKKTKVAVKRHKYSEIPETFPVCKMGLDNPFTTELILEFNETTGRFFEIMKNWGTILIYKQRKQRWEETGMSQLAL